MISIHLNELHDFIFLVSGKYLLFINRMRHRSITILFLLTFFFSVNVKAVKFGNINEKIALVPFIIAQYHF